MRCTTFLSSESVTTLSGDARPVTYFVAIEREITGEDAGRYWVRLIRRFRGLLGGVAAGGL